MMTAVAVLALIAGVYLFATMDAGTETSWSDLSDQEKLDELALKESQREADRATNRRELYGKSSYCYRIDNTTLRKRCLDNPETTTVKSSAQSEAANTMEPLQNVSTNDERRFNRAELYEDTTYCDEITDTDLRLYCYEELS